MYVVGELAKWAGDVVASTVGGTAGPLVATLMTTAAVVTHNPELAAVSVPTGAFVDAMTEQGVLLMRQTLLNRAERVRNFADAVAEEAGQSAEDFIAEHVADARDREFLGRVVDAATAARSDWKTRVLARAYVRGAKDGDLIDETEMFVSVTRDVEPIHARFLAAVYPLFHRTGRLYASLREVTKKDKGIGPAGALLWRHLRDRGLLKEMEPGVEDTESDAFRLTDLGAAVAEWLDGLGIALDASNGDRGGVASASHGHASDG
jgi:hypothetical protein